MLPYSLPYRASSILSSNPVERAHAVSVLCDFWANFPAEVNRYRRFLTETRAAKRQIKLEPVWFTEDPYGLNMRVEPLSVSNPTSTNVSGSFLGRITLSPDWRGSVASEECYFRYGIDTDDLAGLLFARITKDSERDEIYLQFDFNLLTSAHVRAETILAGKLIELGYPAQLLLRSGALCRRMDYPPDVFWKWPSVLNYIDFPNLSDEDDEACYQTPILLDHLRAESKRLLLAGIAEAVEFQKLLISSQKDSLTAKPQKTTDANAGDSYGSFNNQAGANSPPTTKPESILPKLPPPQLPPAAWVANLKPNLARNRLFRYWREVHGWTPSKIRMEYNRLKREEREVFGNGEPIDLDTNRRGLGVIYDGIRNDKEKYPEPGFPDFPR